MFDMEHATRDLTALLGTVTDEQLSLPTPCPEYTVGDLIDHVNGLSLAFTWAATKQFPPGAPQGPSGDASRLGADWRSRIPLQLKELAQAWRAEPAWQGMTRAGGIDLPAEVAGRVALNEVVVHSWDIARALGRPFDPAAADVALCAEFLGAAVDEEGNGLFGAVVPVGAQATGLDRLIGLSGRDPDWAGRSTPGAN